MVGKIFSMEDWTKVDVDEIRERWAKRRKEIEEIEKRKTERDKKIEEARKSLDEVGLGDDVKGHGFLMVYTWCAHVQRRLKV